MGEVLADFNAASYRRDVALWLRDQVLDAGCKGVVFGISGGLDSSVVAGLCREAFPGNHQHLALIMPCHSSPLDEEHARLVEAAFNLNAKKVELDEAYDTMLRLCEVRPEPMELNNTDIDSARRLALANLKVRLRMVTWYFHANLHNFMVVGTGNRDELAVGYFTKYGDGAVDLLPLAELVKGQVRQLARELGVPEVIINKPPTAGLWSGQTDEEEMGITYNSIDRYLLGEEVPAAVALVIEKRVEANAHKLRLPAQPSILAANLTD